MRAPLVLAVLGLALALAGCSRDETRGTAPPPTGDPREAPVDPPVKTPETPPEAPIEGRPAVSFETGGAEARVWVEIARTRRQIQRGLMYRTHLPLDQGMLFIMEEEVVQSFWMKNTLVPLDMIFITGDMVVAGVVENAEPKTTTSRTIGKPSRYVLEVNAGWAAENGVAAGAVARFENVEL